MHGLFFDTISILGISATTLLVCSRLRIPTIVGFILAGIVVGPQSTGLVRAVEEVEIIAEIGVVLLLFTIGIEFSLQNLLKIKKLLVVGGLLQVVGTWAAAAGFATAIGLTPARCVFAGCLVCLSSTAIVLRQLQQRGQIDTLPGRTALGILIFQDLLVVPMMLAVPLLAGSTSFSGAALGPFLLKAGGAVALIVVCARWVLPWALDLIGRSRNPELFQVSIMFIGLGIAFVTYSIGLSLALGAFLAGLILSSSQYGRRALGSVLPLRDLFMSFFFVSIGMLLDLGAIADAPLAVFGGAVLLIVLKGAVAAIAGTILGLPLRLALISGVALAQAGEFSFILARSGLKHVLLLPEQFQYFLAVSILSMIAAPFLIGASDRIFAVIARLPLPPGLLRGRLQEEPAAGLSDHLVIIGFGLGGRYVAEAARISGIPTVIIDANPDTVRSERTRGRQICYGDAMSPSLLEHAGVPDARVAVITISDPAGTYRIVDEIRRLNPRIHIIVRARYFSEIDSLQRIGASEVVSEDYEASIEIFTRVLNKYLVPHEEIEDFIARIRAEGYAMLRSRRQDGTESHDLNTILSGMEVRIMRVHPGCGAIGRSLGELNLRKDYGITVLAVLRRGEKLLLPGGTDTLEADDRVVLLGLPELLMFADGFFAATGDPTPSG